MIVDLLIPCRLRAILSFLLSFMPILQYMFLLALQNFLPSRKWKETKCGEELKLKINTLNKYFRLYLSPLLDIQALPVAVNYAAALGGKK